MELSELLRKRRACRDFTNEPVPDELLRLVADAAGSASTASNVPYRHVMIVDDPRVIRAVRQISPALQADPPALIIIITDVAMAIERVGPVGEASSLIDSGAAGENAWLAAIDAGLASGFTMISAMAGIRTILRLPAQMRVDLILPVGFPAPTAGPASGRRRPTRPRRNQFGDVDD